MAWWGGGKGKEYIHTHAWQRIDALRFNGCTALQRNAMEWKWVGILLLSFDLLVSCCLKSARAPDRCCCCCCYCWLLAVQVHNSNAMQWN